MYLAAVPPPTPANTQAGTTASASRPLSAHSGSSFGNQQTHTQRNTRGVPPLNTAGMTSPVRETLDRHVRSVSRSHSVVDGEADHEVRHSIEGAALRK